MQRSASEDGPGSVSDRAGAGISRGNVLGRHDPTLAECRLEVPRIQQAVARRQGQLRGAGRVRARPDHLEGLRRLLPDAERSGRSEENTYELQALMRISDDGVGSTKKNKQ